MKTVTIGGKNYPVEIVNGERMIDGKTVDDFMKTLCTEDLLDLGILGAKVMANNIITSPQNYINALVQSKKKN